MGDLTGRGLSSGRLVSNKRWRCLFVGHKQFSLAANLQVYDDLDVPLYTVQPCIRCGVMVAVLPEEKP